MPDVGGGNIISAAVSIVRALACCAVLLLAACRSAAVPGVVDVRFAEPRVGLSERTAQVERAGAGLGWTMTREAPGRIRAGLGAGRERVAVTITFDPVGFSIRHEDGGTGIEHDERVVRLRDAIVLQSSI